MRKRNTIIFDMDGTLLNTLDDIADSLNFALEHFGYPVHTVTEIRKMIGGGATILIERAAPKDLSAEKKDELLKFFTGHYFKNANNKTDLYDGVRPLADRLYEEGYDMAIVSNKGDKAVKELADIYFPDMMKLALGERPDVKRKPAPDALLLAMDLLGVTAEECIYVGDSEVDAQFSINAKVPCVIVTWGFRDREELEPMNPDAIVDTVEELYEQILLMGGK
ncbi:MAG: HAD family hydrolase [Lachnospiraceae bacterium]|nr:HAD family hydrolase [Lachnospiraceae bacterium]